MSQGPAFFYGINGGASVGCILEEVSLLLGMIQQLAGVIAESMEGCDNGAAQLAYAVLRFAEQGEELVSSAIGAEFIPPSAAP